MRISASTSVQSDGRAAAREVLAGVASALGGRRPDLALVFASLHHGELLEETARQVAGELGTERIIGCLAESVIGGPKEFEGTPALSLWAAQIPEAPVTTASIEFRNTPDGPAFLGIPELPEGKSTMLFCGDPFSFPAAAFLKRISEERPELRILGGMASGAGAEGESRLVLGPRVLNEGAVVAILPAAVPVRPLVSQGCRPFGRSFVITRAERNFIVTLRGKPALEILEEEVARLAPEDRALLAHGLHIGIAIDARKEQQQRGDFVIRNVLGVVQNNGAIVVADAVRAGQTVQFHLRDAGTASEDLHTLLREARAGTPPPAGALLFTCNGRGRRLFQAESHDAGAIAQAMGGIPVAGFFAAGEIGPVGGQNFLHGFTASMAIFD
jgi:small ligand-binding sensory domain FIST